MGKGLKDSLFCGDLSQAQTGFSSSTGIFPSAKRCKREENIFKLNLGTLNVNVIM